MPGPTTSLRQPRGQQAALQHPGANRVQRHAGHAPQRLHEVIDDASSWLSGESDTLAGNAVGASGLGELFTVTSRRLMFNQPGLPRAVAEEQQLPYAETINPSSLDVDGLLRPAGWQQRTSRDHDLSGGQVGQADHCARRDYFARGSIVHLSHVIQDLEQFYERPEETFTRRAAAMFTSNPVPATGNPDQFTDGGGPAFIDNFFVGPTGAPAKPPASRTFDGQPHIGHVSALQRSSRAPNTQGDPHSRRWPRIRLARRPRRLTAAEAALQHLRAHGRLLRHHAAQPGLARPRPAVRRAAPEPRPRALHHRHAAAELPRAAAAPSGLSVA